MARKPKTTKQINLELTKAEFEKIVNKVRNRLGFIRSEIDALPDNTTREVVLKQELSVVERLVEKGLAKLAEFEKQIEKLEKGREK